MHSEPNPMQYVDLLSHMPRELRQGLKCFSFSRWGGFSQGPYAQLNVGDEVGDRPEHVRANLDLIKGFMQVPLMAWANQVHGTSFFCADDLEELAGQASSMPEADGIFTSRPGIGLLIKHADCQAVVMYDPVRKVAANVHCGWRGSVQNILQRAVKRFIQDYGSRPSDIWAGISPSLGPCCAEFKGWKKELPAWIEGFQAGPNHFDFWDVSRHQLLEAGIPREQISCAQVCTKCSMDHFSYRRDHITGRLATVVALYE